MDINWPLNIEQMNLIGHSGKLCFFKTYFPYSLTPTSNFSAQALGWESHCDYYTLSILICLIAV